MSQVRDAMVPDPASLDVEATAEDAGKLLARPEVRAVFVCEGDRLRGVVTRKTLVREVVASPTSRSTRPSTSSKSATRNGFR